MKKKMKIDINRLISIMEKRAIFQMKANKKMFMVFRVLSLMIILVVIAVNMFIGLDILLVIIGLVIIVINIFLIESIQIKFTEKAYRRLAKKKAIEYISVDTEITDKGVSAKSTIGDEIVESHFEFRNLYRTYYDSQVEVIIFSQKKYVTNFAKSRPRYISIKDFSETDRLTIIDLFKKHSVIFYSDLQSHKSIRYKPLSKRKKLLTRIFYLLIIGGIILISFLGWFDNEKSLDINQITSDYHTYVTEHTETSFMALGYMEDTNELVLRTFFIESNEDKVFYEIETQFCESRLDSISEGVDVCYDGLTQYGFNSHRSVNIIIRVEKDIHIIVSSDDLDFAFTDDFQEHNYYYASYYGKPRDDLLYYVNDEPYEIN